MDNQNSDDGRVIVSVDPALPNSTTAIALVKDDKIVDLMHIEGMNTVTGPVSSSFEIDSQPPKFNTPEDFWKYDPSPEFEAHAQKFAAAMGISRDLIGLESHVESAAARHRHYAEVWKRRMAGPRKFLASMAKDLLTKFVRDHWPSRPNKFKIVKASSPRKRKHALQRTRSYHKRLPTINWISPTGRLNPSRPAEYHFTRSGVVRTPHD